MANWFQALIGAVTSGQMDRGDALSATASAVGNLESLYSDLRAEIEAIKAGQPLPANISVLHDAAQLSQHAGAVLENITGIAGAAGLPQAAVIAAAAAGIQKIGAALDPGAPVDAAAAAAVARMPATKVEPGAAALTPAPLTDAQSKFAALDPATQAAIMAALAPKA